MCHSSHLCYELPKHSAILSVLPPLHFSPTYFPILVEDWRSNPTTSITITVSGTFWSSLLFVGVRDFSSQDSRKFEKLLILGIPNSNTTNKNDHGGGGGGGDGSQELPVSDSCPHRRITTSSIHSYLEGLWDLKVFKLVRKQQTSRVFVCRELLKALGGESMVCPKCEEEFISVK